MFAWVGKICARSVGGQPVVDYPHGHLNGKYAYICLYIYYYSTLGIAVYWLYWTTLLKYFLSLYQGSLLVMETEQTFMVRTHWRVYEETRLFSSTI